MSTQSKESREYPKTAEAHSRLEEAFQMWTLQPDDARYIVMMEIQRLSRRVEELEQALVEDGDPNYQRRPDGPFGPTD